MTTTYDLLVDASEEDCPMPTIQAKNALDLMTTGQTLKVIASKEGAVKNIRTLVSSNPYELISEAKVNEKFIFFIKSYEHIVRNQESVINKLSYKSFNFLKSVIKN